MSFRIPIYRDDGISLFKYELKKEILRRFTPLNDIDFGFFSTPNNISSYKKRNGYKSVPQFYPIIKSTNYHAGYKLLKSSKPALDGRSFVDTPPLTETR